MNIYFVLHDWCSMDYMQDLIITHFQGLRYDSFKFLSVVAHQWKQLPA